MWYDLRFLFFFLLFAVVPAYYMNRLLLRWIEPRSSVLRLFMYIVMAALAAFGYTVLVLFILLRWTGPLA